VTLSRLKYIIIAICRKIHRKFQRSNARSRILLLANVNERPEITRDISHTFARDTAKSSEFADLETFSAREQTGSTRAGARAQLITRQTLAAVLPETFRLSHTFREAKVAEPSSRRGRRLSELAWRSTSTRKFPDSNRTLAHRLLGRNEAFDRTLSTCGQRTRGRTQGVKSDEGKKLISIPGNSTNRWHTRTCRENEGEIIRNIIVENYRKVIGIITRDRINWENIVRVHQSIHLFADPLNFP